METFILAAGPLLRFGIMEFIAWRERRGRDPASKPSEQEISEFLLEVANATPESVLKEAMGNVPVSEHRPPPPE
jgi:hypothetical protein